MKPQILIGLVSILLSGCWALPPYEPVDFGKTSEGKPFIRDTPRTWNYMRDFLDRAINDELHGLRPSGGYANWNTFWLSSFKVWRNGGQENPEKYVKYIIQRRGELGLPEIIFPPNESLPTR